ncbi:LOW QUALITY PROTEIN: serine/threonine-protein kinase LMTK1 [Anoplopoma fimbria]|uniref:LOW QUALITY PROTEIN: serine/threonine-protein kinase LMTK1 n=1 Tax=Anoplopoma fimbria TaxID=229290 RepID=UPI0023EA8B02|nr:LOW QUALITY PROTEIN: serine/threonine-protein kinase LMTK1 [Anoplopoma fimbria]
MKMLVLLVTVSSVVFSPSFALSSHFSSVIGMRFGSLPWEAKNGYHLRVAESYTVLKLPASSSKKERKDAAVHENYGAPLSELSWSSSLAVVAISLSGLFTFVFLMLTCLCCKKSKTGFKEFRNVDGEEYHADMSTLASPASQGSPDVYILPLTELSLPVAKQPARSVQLLKSTDLSRHSLLYLKEIGNGWFGKVLLGEVNTGLNTTQVVVKELKASSSVQDQMHFLEEAQPFRALQHPALLHCLAQCTEITPYLLVMEFCPLGDVKGYLRSCRSSETMTPEPLILQRMACDIASGLLHMHKHNFTHSDLALRNCLLTADVSVKIGDYGLAQSKYKDDYYMTSDQMCVPLRWIAPELVDEVHGNLLVADQTQHSNMWSLGVTIWELFEMGNQPYRHYSDRQVLTYAVKEQQLRLHKPLLNVPLAERWYEVMQFCWLQPDQRPNAEEVHLLLSYLCAKGASEAEEDFERRWNSLRPNTVFNSHRGASAVSRDHPSSTSSSFPLLEQFSAGDGYHSESGDDILTVTETSHGLNFEYKWEQARADQSYRAPDSSSTLGQVNHHHHHQEAFYPPGGIVGGCPMESFSHGVSPSYYQSKHLHVPGILPVLSAHSPSVSSEYYIRIEEPVDCNIDLDYTMCSYSPDYQGSSGSFLTGSADSGECLACPSQTKNMGPYWSADIHKSDMYDSNDSSPAISLTMEPLLGQVLDDSPLRPWESSHYVSYKDRDGGYYYEHSPRLGIDRYLIGRGSSRERHQESWGSRSLRQALGELENPLGISPAVGSTPQQAYRDPYLDTSQTSIIGKNVTGGYYDMMGSLRKTMPSHTRHNSHSVSINMETEGALFIGHRDSDTEEEEEEDIFVERHTCNTWPSKHRHSSVGHHRRASHSCRQDAYVDFHYTMPSTDIEDSWPEEHSLAFHSLPKPIDYLEPHQVKDNSACISLSKHHAMVPSDNCNAYIYLCHEGETLVPASGDCCHSHFVDPLTGLLVRNNSHSHSYSHSSYISDKAIETPSNEETINLSPAPGGPIVAKPSLIKTEDSREQYVDLTMDDGLFKEKREDVIKENPIMQKPAEPKIEEVTLTMTVTTPPPADNMHVMVALTDPQSEMSHAGDSGVDRGGDSSSLADILDCTDDDDDDDITDDITDVTSGIFADESSELNASPAIKSLQKQVGTPDSMDSMDLPSAAGSCEGFSPASSHPSSSPKAMDSGYDTENNESPEFVPKEPHEPREQPLENPTLHTSLEEDKELEEQEVEGEVEREVEPSLGEDLALGTSQTDEHSLLPLSDKTPYRDSAYFSDYENERQSRDEGEELPQRVRDEEMVEKEQRMGERKGEKRKNEEEEEPNDTIVNKDIKLDMKHISTGGTESSSPLEMDACLTEECDQDEVLGLHMEPSDTASIAEVGLDEWPSQEESSSLGDWAAEVVGAMEEALGALNGDCTSNVKEEEEEEEEEAEDSVKDLETPEEPEIKTIQSRPSGISGEILHTLPKDEVALQHTASTRRFSSSSPPPPSTPPPPLPATDGRGSPAYEDDGDSDDSDESDEELRIYSVQEQSGGEESEDECFPVPIVVSDSSENHKLRSLLKMPTLLTTENLEEELACKKKTVSFFDDVTVYLFDQESPTKELVEHGFPLGAEGQSSRSKSQERLNASDDSSDGNVSEESAGYEWEDDFPLLPLQTSSVASDSPPPRSVPKAPDPKPAVQFSRFTVSPSNVSRFSITHISDSDMDSVGGSSEDGDKE